MTSKRLLFENPLLYYFAILRSVLSPWWSTVSSGFIRMLQSDQSLKVFFVELFKQGLKQNALKYFVPLCVKLRREKSHRVGGRVHCDILRLSYCGNKHGRIFSWRQRSLSHRLDTDRQSQTQSRLSVSQHMPRRGLGQNTTPTLLHNFTFC